MLSFAFYGNILIDATEASDVYLVNELMGCVILPLELMDKTNDAILYIDKETAARFLKGECPIYQEIVLGSKKKEVIDGAVTYFKKKIVNLIIPAMKADLISNLSKSISSDGMISEKKKTELLSLANEDTLAEFLASVFLYVINESNIILEKITEHNNLPPENKYFCGRTDQLKSINNLFKEIGHNAVNICQTVSGLGGIGKTALAIEYAYRYYDSYKNCIWFINADTATTTQNYFVDFANHFNLKLPPEYKPEELQQAVKTWLSENIEWLLIFDKLESVDTINPYLPNMINGRMIITTRNTRIDLGSQIALGVFDTDEALLFLKRRLSNNEKLELDFYNNNDNDFDTEAPNLITRLGFLPLALEQAAAYIKEGKCTIIKYLKLLSESGLSAFEEKYAVPEHYEKSNDFEKIVTATWNISFKSIPYEGSRQLLNLCAYMAPYRIPVAFFARMREKLPSPIKEDMAEERTKINIVGALRVYSLTTGDADYINVHRLVQEVVRKTHKVVRECHEDFPEWLNICLDIFLYDIPRNYDDLESKDKFNHIAKHAFSVANYAYSYFENRKSRKNSISELYYLLGFGFNEVCQYNSALECYKKTLEIRENVSGKKHFDVAATYNNIGNIYKIQGHDQMALECLKKALEVNINILGEEHLSTATTYNNIAIVYSHLCEFSKALEFFHKALAIHEKILGQGHPSTAVTYNNIAGVYADQNDYVKALEWYQKALTIYKNVLGQEHPNIATTYNNIAGIYANQGNYDKALELYFKALTIYEKVLGQEHPNIAETYDNIAGVYSNQGDYGKALEWYQSALTICGEVLGQEHRETAITYNNIAGIYANQGDYDKALEWYQKALTIYEKVLGNEENPYIAGIHANIATVESFKNTNGNKSKIGAVSIPSQFIDLPLIRPKNLSETEISEFCNWYASLDSNLKIKNDSEFRMFLSNLLLYIVKIKEISEFFIDDENAPELCQYTKLSTLKYLLKASTENDNIPIPKFRLSNVAYLNDPSEGQVFFDLLSHFVSDPIFNKPFGILAENDDQPLVETHLNDVYIGSFSTAKNKLPMWTLYGDKSNGCCIVFNNSVFTNPRSQVGLSTAKEFEQDIRLYKVHYYNTKEFNKVDDEIVRSLKSIATSIVQWREIVMQNQELLRWMVSRLDEIRFLFKSDDYSYENEIRLILRDNKVNKPFVDRSDDVPKLFINVNNPVVLKEVILGAKVENPSAVAQFLLYSGVKKVTLSGITFR
jgi:tetratricopeptide (TPR) repeat protein